MFYSPKGYRVSLPAGAWRASTLGRADLELTGVGTRAGMLVHASCDGNPPRRPLSVLARHLTFGVGERKLLEREDVVVGGDPGTRMLFDGELAGAPVTVEAVVVKGAGCVYDFIYAASPDDFASGRDEFREVVGSFARR